MANRAPPQPKQLRPSSQSPDVEGLLMLGFALVFIVGAFLRRMIGRVGGAAVTAGIGAGISWLLIGTAIAAGTVAVLLFLLSLLVNFAGLSQMGRGGRSGGWSVVVGRWRVLGGGGGWSGGGGGGGGSSGGW
jgi:uncharacterized protein